MRGDGVTPALMGAWLQPMLGQTRIYGAERPRCAHTSSCQVFKSVSDYDAT